MAEIFFRPSVSQENGSSNLFSLNVACCVIPLQDSISIYKTNALLFGSVENTTGKNYMFTVKQPNTLQVRVPKKQIRTVCIIDVPKD